MLPQRNMLGDGFRHSVKDSLEEIQLSRLLDLNEDNLTLAVARLDVDAVELVALILLVALAFQYLHNLDFLTDKHGH